MARVNDIDLDGNAIEILDRAYRLGITKNRKFGMVRNQISQEYDLSS